MNSTWQQILLIASLLVASCAAQAKWLASEGKSIIIQGNISQARDKAVTDALLSIMHKSGTSVESVQVVKSGVLATDQLTIRTNGEVHDMRLLNEEINKGYIMVSIKADIYPFRRCPKEKYAKTLLVGPFQLQIREQAQLGGIYHSDEALTQRLFYHLKRHSRKLDPRHVLIQPIAFPNDQQYNIEQQFLEVARQISSQYDVQYQLFGTIEDMSSFDESSNNLLFPSSIKKRHFQMNIYLIDGINRQTVFQKNYAYSSDWPFDMTQKFNVNSNEFWATDYGKIIDQAILKAGNDIEQAVYCQPTMATIIALHNNGVVINIGFRNGLKKGDQFQLIRSQFTSHQSSQLQGPIFTPDNVMFSVVSVQSDRAILKPQRGSDMGNVQIRDMLTPVDEYFLQQLEQEKEQDSHFTD